MGSLGIQEIIVIFVIALIVFGPRKLPEIGKSLGKALQEFKKASNELKRTWEEEVQLEHEKDSVTSILKETSAEISKAAAELTDPLPEYHESFTLPPHPDELEHQNVADPNVVDPHETAKHASEATTEIK